MNLYWRAPRRQNNYNSGLAALKKLFRGKKSGSGARFGKSAGGSTGGSLNKSQNVDRRQKCISKMNYSKDMKAHLKQINDYLTREGTDRDGGKPELYGSDSEQYKKHIVEKNYRIFLSPQRGDVPLEALTKAFMKRLEHETGKKYYWLGVNHYNTGHPHSHILINGIDQKGKSVFISRDMVKTFMRESARDICTALIGGRSDQDIQADRERQLEASRWTNIDEQLKKIAVENNISLEREKTKKERKERLKKRLNYLVSIGLCEKKKKITNCVPTGKIRSA